MSKYKLIIFDLDDTLFDYKATEKEALSIACFEQGLSFSDDVYAVYKKANQIAKVEFPNYIFDLNKFRRIRANIFFKFMSYENFSEEQFINDYLNISSQKGILLPEVFETISAISKNSTTKMVVATNGTDYPRKNKLFNSDIAQFIYKYYSSENMKVAKPNANFFINIIKDCAVSNDEVIVIGDDWATDILGSINVGILSCWFNWKEKPYPSSIPHGVKIITKFSELRSITE